MLGGIGFQEIIIIVIVGLLVFGATRLPKIAKSLGQGIKEFKKSVKDRNEDEENSIRYVDQGQYNQPQQFGQYQGSSQGYNPNQQQGQYPPQWQGYDSNQQQGQYPPVQGYAQNQSSEGESTPGQGPGQKADKPEENQKS